MVNIHNFGKLNNLLQLYYFMVDLRELNCSKCSCHKKRRNSYTRLVLHLKYTQFEHQRKNNTKKYIYVA